MRPATGSVSWFAGAGADASQAAKARSPISGPIDLRSASSFRIWPFISVVSFTVGVEGFEMYGEIGGVGHRFNRGCEAE